MGKSNEELQRLIDERDRELKIAQREAEKWKASSDLLESRVQGLVRMVNEMEEKMQARRRSVRRLCGQATQFRTPLGLRSHAAVWVQRLDAAHRKEVAIWEQQAKMFMRGKN